MALTSIANRLTPSAPIEITFGSQTTAVGRKFSTLFGHKASTGDTGMDYQVYTVINVGDAIAAQTEVDSLAGSGSQIGKMAYAFVNANAAVGGSNFPAFRVVLLPNAETGFGSASEAINAVKFLRSDALVSCYPTSDATNLGILESFCETISGPDRDLRGQFGSFVHTGSLDSISTQVAYNINKRFVLAHALPDSNTTLVTVNGTVTSGSKIITAISSTVGIYLGAQVSGTGVAAGSVVTGFTNSTVTISLAATSSHVAESIGYQNVVSQAPEIVAAACAAGVMASAFPYNPLQNVAIGGLVPPKKSSDWIEVDPSGSSEALLVAGLAPLQVQPGNSVAFIRTRTTWLLNGSAPVINYFDWQQLVLLNDFREECYLITQNPPFNNNPGGTKASLLVAASLKDEILRKAFDYEARGAFQGVKALAPLFIVQPSATSPGRFDFKIPLNVLPGLYVISGNIEAVSGAGLGDFTL